MARHNLEAEIKDVVELLEGIRPDADDPHELPGAIEVTPEERAARFALELRETVHAGREMAGPYVQSFYGEKYSGGPELPTWLANTDNKHVQHFLEMHDLVRGDLQAHLGVQHAFLGGKHKFALTLERLMDAGVLTGFTNNVGDRNTFLEAIANAGLHIGNVGDTYADGLEGYYDSADKAMVVAPGAGRTLHERVVDTQDRIDRVLPRVFGGLYGKGTEGWMRTAFGEHLGQVMRDDGFAPQVISPARRGEDDREGHPFALFQRELIDKMLTYGKADLTKDFMLAMTSNGLDSKEWGAFRESFNELWGVDDAFERVTGYMQKRIADAEHDYPEAIRITHQETAAKATLEAIQQDPAQVFGRPNRAKPVGAIAMHVASNGGAHRRK